MLRVMGRMSLKPSWDREGIKIRMRISLALRRLAFTRIDLCYLPQPHPACNKVHLHSCLHFRSVFLFSILDNYFVLPYG